MNTLSQLAKARNQTPQIYKEKPKMKDLDNLKKGDLVLYSHGFGFGIRTEKILHVERTTKTQIILSNGGKFKKSSGYRVGDSGSLGLTSGIRIPTGADVERVRKKQAIDSMMETVSSFANNPNLLSMTADEINQVHLRVKGAVS